MNEFSEIQKLLRSLLIPYSKNYIVLKDTKDEYHLNAPLKYKGNDLYFGGVAIKKNYVSFYLMALYAFPELVKEIPESLAKLKQGKSCFNFKHVSQINKKQLEKVIKICFNKYQKDGKIFIEKLNNRLK